ncbi:ABC transporter ATP-binding protein [Spirillospora sp. NBC_01491]|uniref:ABC transporter ATP-binding protein n=1 Tax=Spirillospora sp. NBC_01491 TaxID=2976007 RepID=UPI002E3261FC|nr:ABC transporter ATP-binding protein [Spirillospora sp. NBC_01491]
MKPLPVEDPGTPDQRTPARYLLWLARVQRRGVAWGGLLGVVWMLSQALMPAAVGRAIDQGVAAKDTRALLAWTGAMVALGVVQALSGVARHRVAVFNWLSAAYRTVQVVTRQSTRLGASLHRRLSAGEVVSVGISDVAHIGDALDILARGTGSVVAVVVVAIILLAASPPLGLIVLVGVPLILLAAAPLLRPLREREHRHRELIGELNTHATDLVAGLRVLRGVGGEKLFAGRYRAESQRVRRAGVDVARAESMLSGAEILLPGLLVALVTWVGARFTADGTLSVGQLVAFYGYAVFLIQPLKMFGEAAGKFTKAHVSAARVVRMLAMDPELPCAGTARPDGPAELVDVASGLVVRPGVFTAVAAAEPRDAQAIADRLGRYADGEVTYGGVPLADVAGIRERILVAVNEDRLFSGTLRDSLATGTGAQASGDDLLGRALRTASAEDIVAASGLDGHVAEAGREFSGGQRQRLRLARALAADHEVLVLIEPTSAVDAHTEARIAGRLGPARAGRTTVVCTTSPLVLDRADHVVFVERGRVVAEGAHRDLLDTEPRYAATVTREEAAARP